jgi:hypothetical protein
MRVTLVLTLPHQDTKGIVSKEIYSIHLRFLQQVTSSSPSNKNSFRLLRPFFPAIYTSRLCTELRWNRPCIRPGQHHPVVEVRRTSIVYFTFDDFVGRQHNDTHPITKEPLTPADLITLHYSRKEASGEIHDPISFKTFSEHSHIVAIATTGNVFLSESIKGGQDLVNSVAFKKYVSLYAFKLPNRKAIQTGHHHITKSTWISVELCIQRGDIIKS